MSDDDRCQAISESTGDQCKNPAGEDGYCHVKSHGGSEDEPSDGSDSPARMYQPGQVAEAIRANNGNLAAASRTLECHRSTVYRFCEEFEQCEQAKQDERATLVDEATDTLRELLTGEDKSIQLKAAKFINKHYDDDAKTRTDVTSDDDHLQARQDAMDELDEMSSEEKVQLWRELSEVHDHEN